MSVISEDELPFDEMTNPDVNDENAMWRGYHNEMRKRSARAGEKAAYRIAVLETAGLVRAVWNTKYHVTLSSRHLAGQGDSPVVEFYPTRGTIVWRGARHGRRGLDAALRLIGVSAKGVA